MISALTMQPAGYPSGSPLMESGGSPNWSVCTGDGIEQSSGGGLILQVLL